MVWEGEGAMSYDPQNRRRFRDTVGQMFMLQRRIKRTQRRMAALEGEARQALEDILAADQAALAEVIPTFNAVRAVMRQEEEHVRGKTQEALRAQAELRASYSLHYLPGGGQPSPSQAMGLLVALAAIVAFVGVVLLLNR